MTLVPHLLIRADAGGYLGSGHVMRMIALAQAWQDRGGSVTLASCQCPHKLRERLVQENIHVLELGDLILGGEEDRQVTVQEANRLECEWLVLDGYHFGVDYQRALRGFDFKVLCIDDYGHCDIWACDVLLNQNLGTEKNLRSSEVVPFTQLLGAKYVLLRREFRQSRRRVPAKESGPLRRILVTMGGVDPKNATGQVLELLEDVKLERLAIRVLVGASNPNVELLRKRKSRHEMEILENVSDMPSQYDWADGVVSAGGSTCWELLFWGLPTVVVVTADNQVFVADELDKRGFAINLGWFHQLSPVLAAPAIENWLKSGANGDRGTDPEVDGLGAMRVAAYLLGAPLMLRHAVPGDVMTYFRWVNEAEVRHSAFNTDPIPIDSHKAWFAKRISSDGVEMFVAETLDGAAVGQVRFEMRSDDGRWYLDYSVAAEFRGLGLGVPLVSEATGVFLAGQGKPPTGIVAEVKLRNEGSIKTLERAGFERLEDSKQDGERIALFLWSHDNGSEPFQS